MTYAKLKADNLLSYYRQPIHTDTHDIFTTNPATLAEYGFYPLCYTVPPEVDEHHVAVPHWEQVENEIVQVWTIEEIPETDEISDEEALAIIAEGAE